MNASLSVDGPRPRSMLLMDMVICCSMSAESLHPVCATCCCLAILKTCAEERYLPRLRLDAMAWTSSAVIGRGGNFHDVARRVQRFHLESRVLRVVLAYWSLTRFWIASCCTAGAAASNAPTMDPLVDDVTTGKSLRPRVLISVVRLGMERPSNRQKSSRSRCSGAIAKTCSGVRPFI